MCNCMKTRLLILFLIILNFYFCYSQNEKYKLKYTVHFLPGNKKINGKIFLTKNESKKIYEILNSEKKEFYIDENDFKILNKISDSLTLENDLIKKCEKIKSEIKPNENLILNYLKKTDNNENIDSYFPEMVIVADGIAMKFELKSRNDENILIYRDNYYNKPYFKNLKDFYALYFIVNEIRPKKLKKFKYYFGKNNLYEQVVKLYAYNNCT